MKFYPVQCYVLPLYAKCLSQLSILTHSLCSFLDFRYQVSRPYKTRKQLSYINKPLGVKWIKRWYCQHFDKSRIKQIIKTNKATYRNKEHVIKSHDSFRCRSNSSAPKSDVSSSQENVCPRSSQRQQSCIRAGGAANSAARVPGNTFVKTFDSSGGATKPARCKTLCLRWKFCKIFYIYLRIR